jgi:hypothetical protein
MKDFLKSVVFGAVVCAVVTLSVLALGSLGGEPEQSLVRAILADRATAAAAAASPRCAPGQMPCFQSDSGS